ncbi:MAG: hypothetical protein OIF57_09280 [Marinobacterium sp.]|nr:hypothetical protein [Marinobacterium sp.]
MGYYRLRSPMRLLTLQEMSQFTELSAREALIDSLAYEVRGDAAQQQEADV